MPRTVLRSINQTYQNVQNFVTSHETSSPNDTVEASFQRSEGVCKWYVVYRWVQCGLHLFIYFASFFDLRRRWAETFTAPYAVHKGVKYYAKWFLYLTHWGLVLNLLQGLLGAVIVTSAFKNQNNPTPNTVYGVSLKLASFYRYSFGVALNLSLWIAVGFWTLIHTPLYFKIDLVTVSQHGLCTLALLVDLFIVKFPYKLATALYTCGVGVFYQNLLIVHFILGALDRYQDRPYLYEVQDWHHPFTAVIILFSVMLTLVSLNFLLWGLYLIKRNFIEVHRRGM